MSYICVKVEIYSLGEKCIIPLHSHTTHGMEQSKLCAYILTIILKSSVIYVCFQTQMKFDIIKRNE